MIVRQAVPLRSASATRMRSLGGLGRRQDGSAVPSPRRRPGIHAEQPSGTKTAPCVRNRLACNSQAAYILEMSNSDSRRQPPPELAAFTVVDLLDALEQSGSGPGQLVEQQVLTSLLRVSACEDLPEPMRILAGQIAADQLARYTAQSRADQPMEGAWLLH